MLEVWSYSDRDTAGLSRMATWSLRMAMAFSPSLLDLYTPFSMTRPMGTPVDMTKKSVLMPPSTW